MISKWPNVNFMTDEIVGNCGRTTAMLLWTQAILARYACLSRSHFFRCINMKLLASRGGLDIIGKDLDWTTRCYKFDILWGFQVSYKTDILWGHLPIVLWLSNVITIQILYRANLGGIKRFFRCKRKKNEVPLFWLKLPCSQTFSKALILFRYKKIIYIFELCS